MTDDSVTVQVLRDIRDEVRLTNKRLDQTNERLEQTRTELSASLEQTRTELSARLGHVETTLVELAEQQRFVVRWLKAKDKRERRVEGEVALLKARVDAIEDRLPERNE